MAWMYLDYGSCEAQSEVEDTDGNEEKDRSEYSSTVALLIVILSPLICLIYFLDILMEGRIKKIMRNHQDFKNLITATK